MNRKSLPWLIALVLLGLLLLCSAIDAHADDGYEVRLVRTQGEVAALVMDGWTYTGPVRWWPGVTEYRVQRRTLAWQLRDIERELLCGCEMRDGGFWMDAETLDRFTVAIEQAAARAEEGE